MEAGLAGRVALVTGGSRGIGRSVAVALVGAGARVSICGRTAADLAEAAAEMRSAGGDAFAMVADMAKHADIEGLVQATVEHYGSLDILVNNAVSSYSAPFGGLSEDHWHTHISVKLLGYVRCARAALPHLQASGHGRIVNIAGMAARDVTEFRITNGVVNAGVANFTKHLAEQVGQHGITVNAVHPGYTWTPRFEKGIARHAELWNVSYAEARERRRQEIPIGRFIQPEDIAHLVVFLCSDAASAITGQAIAVDGGSGRSISY